MKKIVASLLFFILLFLSPACKETVKENKEVRTIPEKVTIYLYEDFPKSTAEMLKRELDKYFPEVAIKDSVLSLPEKYFLKERNRYRGTGLLEDLKGYRKGDAVIGLTNRIIYKENEISPTFGIMGVSPIGKYVCVVSSKIPSSGKYHSPENLVKLSLHELGHAYGLPHCRNQKCYMVDAEHKMKFHNTPSFCDSCRNILKKKGWKLS